MPRNVPPDTSSRNSRRLGDSHHQPLCRVPQTLPQRTTSLDNVPDKLRWSPLLTVRTPDTKSRTFASLRLDGLRVRSAGPASEAYFIGSWSLPLSPPVFCRPGPKTQVRVYNGQTGNTPGSTGCGPTRVVRRNAHQTLIAFLAVQQIASELQMT